MSEDKTTPSARELDRLIRHLRKKEQTFIENIGGWRHEARTDDCLAADYLEAMRSELPHWQTKEDQPRRSDTTGLAPTELVQIEGDDIVIRITLDALVFATEHGCLCTFSKIKNDFRTVHVHDPAQWRGAIVRALRREQENGDTPVHLMLDGALEYAADQGEEGISIEGVLP